MTRKGGARIGAGRPAGSPNKATIHQKTCLSNLARMHTETAFMALIDVAENGQSDTARISAACALLDRGYGKPREADISEYPASNSLDALEARSLDDLDVEAARKVRELLYG